MNTFKNTLKVFVFVFKSSVFHIHANFIFIINMYQNTLFLYSPNPCFKLTFKNAQLFSVAQKFFFFFLSALKLLVMTTELKSFFAFICNHFEYCDPVCMPAANSHLRLLNSTSSSLLNFLLICSIGIKLVPYVLQLKILI